ENLPGNRLERVKRDQLLALQQPLESLDARFDLNPLVRHSPSGFRQRDASAVGNPDHEQRQVFQVRFMKARHKAFHAQGKLVSYIPQIHLLLLVVYLQQLQEILMYLLLAFKKRPPIKVNGWLITVSRCSPMTNAVRENQPAMCNKPTFRIWLTMR